ncbi:MAG: DUF1571 domain-containing protein [Gemmataceae bacterium]|nr:DUF1571 domain-containing protein [Gemmataceae bacterium]
MTLWLDELVRLARAVFAPARRDTLTPVPLSGGGRMVRRAGVLVVALAVLAGAGYAGYALLWQESPPPQVEPPKVVDAGDRLPTADEFAELARTDPVGMLQAGLTRYKREVKGGFRAVLHKRERIGGTLHPPERVRIAVRNDPLAVSMIWEEGARKVFGSAPVAALYPYTDGKADPPKVDPPAMAAWRPDALLEVGRWRHVEVKGSSARDAARYCITDSGFEPAMLRTHAAWKQAKDRGDPAPAYLGLRPVPELGGRPCHVVRRACPKTEADSFALDEARPTDPRRVARDGFDEVTILVDAETWLQTGTVLKKANGDLVGEYHFRDVELFPDRMPDVPFAVATIKAVPAAK